MGIRLLMLICAFSMLSPLDHATAVEAANAGGKGSIQVSAVDHQAAYADILDEYHDFMFYRESAQQDLNEGKVALRDVYGDDKPELLFVYRKHEGAENLRIYTTAETRAQPFFSTI